MRSTMRSFVILALLLSFFACKDDDGEGIAKVASVSNISYSSGAGTIHFQWDNPDISGLAYTEISYKDNQNELCRVLVNASLTEYEVVGLGDKEQREFTFVCFNTEGISSEPVIVFASPEEPLLNIFETKVNVLSDFGGVNVSWENDYDQEFYIKVDYTDMNGNYYPTEILAPAQSKNSQFVSVGANITGTQSLAIRTYVVDIYGNSSRTRITQFYKMESGKLDRSKWIIADKSSQSAKAENVLDGDINTVWENEWSSGTHVFPHYLTFDLGSKKRIEKAEFTHRQNKIEARGLELWGNNKSAKAASHEWTLFGSYDMDQSNKNPQTYTLPSPVNYRYVKLVFTTPGTGDTNNAALAEFVLYGQDVSEE